MVSVGLTTVNLRRHIRVSSSDHRCVWTLGVGQIQQTNTLSDGGRRRPSRKEVVAKCGAIRATNALHPDVGSTIPALEGVTEGNT